MPRIPPGTQTRDLSTMAGRLSAAWDALRGRPFGPGDPIEPAQEGGAAEQEPRQFHYPPSVNTNWQPRREYAQLTPFAQLRNLAGLYDVAALCIGTRVEEMQGLPWAVVAKNQRDQVALQAECDAAIAFFQSPDRLNDFSSWLAMMLYDLFSIDALTLYKRPTRAGGLYALEPVDGSTVKPLLDERGRTLAYQQIMYGRPESQYRRPTAEADDEQLPIYAPTELVYRPRWTRTFTPYGFPPTEWIILRVNMALRKQTFDLAYFTDGNVPEGFASAPEGLMTPQQIQEFEEYFNAVLTGADSARRRIKFMPWEAKLLWSKQFNYEPVLDRWLLGVTCAAYGVMPHEIGFVEDVNRATAEQQENVNERRGLRPLAKWLKESILDPAIASLEPDGRPAAVSLPGRPTRPRVSAFSQLEWQWRIGQNEDALVVAQTDQIYISTGVVSADEVRGLRFADELDGPAPGAPAPQLTVGAPTVTPGQEGDDAAAN